MLHNLEGYDVILASRSPRRKALLSGLGVAFRVITSNADESVPSQADAETAVRIISQRKAHAVLAQTRENSLIIAADTIVYIDGEIVGKPQTQTEACLMLSKLSGRWHDVLTGVTLLSRGYEECFSVRSSVRFMKLSPEEISYYVEMANPLDKAGAYGIQEWIGLVGIAEIRGSFYNVMGLPTSRLYAELKKVPCLC